MAPRLVEFPSRATILRGLLYEHPGGQRRPAVVMAHGLSATIVGMVADRYAEVLHAAGLTVLLFDHASFGLSDGEPRGVVNRWTQIREYADALSFAATLPSVDPARVAIWGDSFSAGLAIAVGAFDDRVAALVLQVPATGRTDPPDDPDGSAFAALREIYRTASETAFEVDRQPPRAVVSADRLASPSILEPITAFRWFIDYGARHGTGWENQATVVAPRLPVPYHAGLCARHLRPPSLWVVAENEEMPGADTGVAKACFELVPGPKELLSIDGGHFGLLYYPSELFDRVSAAQADFLLRHL